VHLQDFAPKVTMSVAEGDVGTLMDGKDSTAVVFPSPKPGAPVFIQFEFAQPYGAHQLALKPGLKCYMGGCHGTLEVSDDGLAFRTVTTFDLPQNQEKQAITFAPVSARFYRVLFTRIDIRMKGLAIAEVELTPKLGINNIFGKAFYSRIGDYTPAGDGVFTPDEVVARTNIVDLTSRLGVDGKLSWNVPDGDWIILRVGYTPTGIQNHPVAKEGTGLECDKLSREAVVAHWAGMMDKVIKEVGPLVGKTLNSVHIDSYEVGSQNWTPKFRDEFQKRRGYDLLPFLPALRGRVVDSPEVTERFL
ncbi:MAG: glycosyl hydrolase, partial [Verrucomicrobia bacterium]|nr:glycosyl hydrolase [Verrucomicrobiota bacterium]